MKRNNFLRQFSLPFLIALYFIQASYAFSQSNVNLPYQIKRIYIEAMTNEKAEIRIEPFLKAALEKRGFEIVTDTSRAEAVLSGEIQIEVVLDGDGSIPDKSIYQYQLISPGKEIIWKDTIKFVSKRSVAEDYEYAAKKIAEKIVKKVSAK